jgi:uncharacterized protein YndB with AHSA1/START domain
MHHIIHRIGIKAPASQVYQALSTLEGLAGWWTEEVCGSPTVGGGNIEFRFRAPSGDLIGKMLMEVRESSLPNE